jgi:hypothetical protein
MVSCDLSGYIDIVDESERLIEAAEVSYLVLESGLWTRGTPRLVGIPNQHVVVL